MRYKKDTERNTVSASVEIREGPYYDIEFEGNEAFWDLTLRKDLVLFQDGNPRGLGLRKSIRKMKERYREKGYHGNSNRNRGRNDGKRRRRARGRCRGRKKDQVGDRRRSSRSVVDSVDISGNLHFEDEQIEQPNADTGAGNPPFGPIRAGSFGARTPRR